MEADRDPLQDPSLEDLCRAYEQEPAKWSTRLSLYLPLKPGHRAVGKTLGPSLAMPLDEDEIWRVCAERLGGAGTVIVRLSPKGSRAGQVTVVVDIEEALWRALCPDAASSSAAGGGGEATPASPPPRAPAPVMAAPQAPWPSSPPTDVLTVLLSSIQSTQNMMLEMIRQNAQPKSDPAIEVLKQQIASLSKQLEDARSAPRTAEKEERAEWVEMATKAAAGNGGLMEAGVKLLAGPIDKLADAMLKTADVRVELEKEKLAVDRANAETRALEAMTKAHAAGLDVGGGDEQEQQQQKPAATA